MLIECEPLRQQRATSNRLPPLLGVAHGLPIAAGGGRLGGNGNLAGLGGGGGWPAATSTPPPSVGVCEWSLRRMRCDGTEGGAVWHLPPPPPAPVLGAAPWLERGPRLSRDISAEAMEAAMWWLEDEVRGGEA